MKRLSEYTGQILHITQPKISKQYFELSSDTDLIATILCKGVFKPTAELEFGKDKWEFFKPNFWRSDIGIRIPGNQMQFALFIKDKWKFNGTIELPKGDRLKLTFNIWKGTFELHNMSGIRLVFFKRKASFKEKTEITIDHASELLDKNPWAVVLCWYLALQNRHNG